MRTLLLAMAGIFIIGGAASLARPKTSFISHQSYRYQPSTTEMVSQDESKIYGVISLSLGTVFLLVGLTWKKPTQLD